MTKIVYTFARMNPITKGHELLLDKMIEKSSKENAKLRVFLSSKVDKKNPLTPDQKLKYFKACYPEVEVVIDPANNDPFKASEKLVSEGFDELLCFAGEDQIKDYTRMKRYIESNFSAHVDVINAGNRDDSDGVSGVSATKLRNAAVLGDLDSFQLMVPNRLNTKYSNEMYENIRQTYGLTNENL